MIPEKNDEIYLYPAFKEIISKIKKNRKLRESFFKKYPLFEFKNKNFRIATGHQPYIFHAGIWAKIIFLNFFKEFEKIFIIQDADVKKGIFLDIPVHRDKWIKIREYIYINTEKFPFEKYDYKKFEEGIKWFYQRFEEIKDYIKKDIAEKIRKFIESLKEVKNPVESLSIARKSFEEKTEYKEFKVSQIARKLNFLKFFLYFFYHAEEILEIYNKRLKEFREIKSIRKEGEPFPFLLKENDFFELPFWCIKEGRRKIFKNKSFLCVENEEICEIKGDFEEDIERIKNLEIRPRAFTLSIYQRVFLSDFFIHGYGGKVYDEFTEEVFEKIFGIKMPECGIVTGTFYPFPGNAEDISKKISSLYDKRNFMLHHPEKFLKDDELILKKKKLVEEIKKSKEKKKISEEIKRINQKLKERVKNLICGVEKEIKKLEEKLEEQKVKYFREYPYFYIDFKRVERAIEKKL